jgi:hypothetical protein
MSSYSYEYFSGANTILTFAGQPSLEVGAIQFNLIDSAIPIYGYNSRLFDAVAPGQVLIQGSFVINFVHPDYLWYAVKQGRKTQGKPITEFELASSGPAFGIENGVSTDVDGTYGRAFSPTTGAKFNPIARNAAEVIQQIDVNDPVQLSRVRGLLESDIWGRKTPQQLGITPSDSKDVGRLGPFDIKIHYAQHYEVLISSAFVVGRGQSIEINEHVIVEEYSFFARTLTTKDVRQAQGASG